MRAEPQAASYRPDTPIETLADWIGDAVEPADFPKTELRFRNERQAATVAMGATASKRGSNGVAGDYPVEYRQLIRRYYETVYEDLHGGSDIEGLP